ncbi:CerR family C-terminal domain-containing protein [Sphingomonas bacterium]|uniref:CerR family C-terminal domain-containing protein n=1 Tax=Sphingomonas bacterium TaxID=1895847 RepID=UPI0015760DC1|nr:CerR family C-terminal domain-containing protein [Sphingomonas bacterium]
MLQTRLLDIAVREFGAKGIDGASTRGIAAAAGTAMSSITYHYGGKEGLYLAAADHIAAQMAREMDGSLDVQHEFASNDPIAARKHIHHLLSTLADKMAADATGDWSLFIMREQLAPSKAFDRIYAGVMGQMLEMLANLVCIASGSRDPRAARIMTLTLFGQVMILRGSRAACLKLLDRDAIEPDDLTDIKARLRVNTDAMIDRLTADERGTQ